MSTLEPRLPPQNREAEEAVLGSLLIDPDAVFEVSNFLRPEHFYNVANGWIFEAVLALHRRNEPVDTLTLLEELRRRDQLQEVGGEPYIIGLVSAVPTSLNAHFYGKIVEATAVRRELIKAAGEIANLAYEEDEDIAVVIDRSEQTLFAVSEQRTTRDLVHVKQIAQAYLERIEELHNRDQDIVGVPTGFTDIDRLLGGLNKSDLLIIAARPGMGKTSFQNGIALTAAQTHGKRVAMFNLEMSGEQLVQRMLAAQTRIDVQRLRRGQLYDQEWPIFYEAVARLSETRIFIDDTPSITPMQLRTKCRRLYAEHGLDMVMIDYLQLMQSDRSGGGGNRVQEIGDISRGLKQLARELDVPVVAAAQLSRAVESRQDKRPMLSDLRDSGCLVGSTLVSLVDGQRLPIGNLVGQSGFKVWAVDESTWELVPATVSRAFSTGVKSVFRLTTRLGRTIRATANHKFRTFDGWKRLDELEVKERLALPRSLPTAVSSASMNDAELALLGHLIGDGCVLARHAIQYTTRELDLAEQVAELATAVFGAEIAPRIQAERSWYQVYLASTRHHTHGVRNAVADWFDKLGIFDLRSHEKFVPNIVFQQPIASKTRFLRHLWATDGCIAMRKTGTRFTPAIYYASSSKTLAVDVQTLLLHVGINARLKCVAQKGKGRDQFHVIVSGHQDQDQFMRLIGAVGAYKQEQLNLVETYLAETVGNTNRDVLPYTVWRQYVVPAMAEQGMSGRDMQAAINQPYCGTSLYKQNVSRERAMRVATAVASVPLQQLADSDIYWDQIVSIEPDGFEEVFDLTVPNYHNFVADNIVVHNSIEQDADIVMFIYRDEYYNPDTTERPGIAEIAVAKHRNGPTATVDLFWNGELASFANLQRQEVQL
jgi:replicative DNA helicase